jgi:hypothetical protein
LLEIIHRLIRPEVRDYALAAVRRQVKKLGKASVFALPKNDEERIVPLPNWVAQMVQSHVAMYKPEPHTLPWERPGRPVTVNLLFRWTDDKHIRARRYDELIWKAALAEASVIPAPEKTRGVAAGTSSTARPGCTPCAAITPA